MALERFVNSDYFKFSNGNEVEFEWENCSSHSDVKTVIYNKKKVRSFKGKCKAFMFDNKKGELDGIVIKVKNKFGKIYYIVINEQKTYIKFCPIKCFELIPTLEKDKKARINSIENLILN